MAASSSRYEDDSDQPRRPRPAKGGSPIVPVLAILLLICAAVYIGKAAQKGPKKETVAAEDNSGKPAPFSSVADELPPDLSARGSRTGVRGEESLLQNPNWVLAKAEAEIGYEHSELSKAAEKLGKTDEYQRQAGIAHDKFSKAVEMTAIWEDELIEKHGDGDPVVKSIRKTRDRWFNQMRKLRAQAK